MSWGEADGSYLIDRKVLQIHQWWYCVAWHFEGGSSKRPVCRLIYCWILHLCSLATCKYVLELPLAATYLMNTVISIPCEQKRVRVAAQTPLLVAVQAHANLPAEASHMYCKAPCMHHTVSVMLAAPLSSKMDRFYVD